MSLVVRGRFDNHSLSGIMYKSFISGGIRS